MAKFRYSVSSKDILDFKHKEGDDLRSILKEALLLKQIHYTAGVEEYFKILVDGYSVENDLWEHTKPSEKQEVIIVAIPRGDNFGAILGAVLLITAAVVSGGLSAGGFLSTLSEGAMATWGTVASTSFGIGASLLLGALISPPQNPGGGGSGSFEESQMFTITSQGNSVKKYGSVPRLYGTHRMFPIIAATPYTELENDPSTGELVQFYYAVFDFGFGPLKLSDIKIGETAISEYSFVDYRLVDFNRPASDEGAWDHGVFNDLSFYKGDITSDNVGVTLNSNQNDGGTTPDQYQAVRNAAQNINNNDQEITLTIVCPQGLVAFASNNTRHARDIELKLEFAVVGTENWRDFDDKSYVYDYNDPYDESRVKIVGKDLYDGSLSDTLQTQEASNEEDNENYDIWANSAGLDTDWFEPNGSEYVYKKFTWNIVTNPSGTSLILDTQLQTGAGIKINGVFIGEVFTSNSVSGGIRHTVRGGVNLNTTYVEYFKYDPDDINGTKEYYFKDYKGYSDTGLPYPDFSVGTGTSEVKVNTFQAGNTQISATKTVPVYGVYKFKPITKSQIKVRVTRIRSSSIFASQVQDAMQWATLQTRFDAVPITTNERHTFLEVKIKATDQLNGSIRNLSAIASSYLEVYNGTSWNLELTNNPAWIYADLLTGSANKRSLPKTRLDTDTLLEWAAYCDEVPTAPVSYGTFLKPRFECNFVLDYQATLATVINQVTSTAQASVNMINGKYGVLIDKNRDVPVQVFTPRNSSGFSATRNYVEVPDAIKIKYVDPGANWEQKERLVYNDGFGLGTAETFDELDTFGVTNNEQAWRFGRYSYANLKLRQERFTLTVDFENLVCTRGDFVLITQDVMKIGGTPARVRSIVSSDTVTIDDEIVTQMGVDYGYTYRSSVGEIVVSTLTVIASDTLQLDGGMPEVGDLFIFGEVDKITYDCIIKSIVPSGNLSAEISLVEKNNAIFEAESSDTIPGYEPQISEIIDISLTAPGPVTDLTVVENGNDCQGRSYIYFVDLAWTPPIGNIYEVFEVYVNTGSGYKLRTTISDSTYRYVVSETTLSLVHSFKVLAVNSSGTKLTLGEVTSVEATPVLKTTPPSNVDGLFINILNETLQLDWNSPLDCDIDSYLIRFSPQSNARWDNSVPILTVDKNNTQAQIPARTGAYLIKARDFNLNESETAAVAITSIPDLVNLNIIDETNDFPTFPGQFDKVVNISDALLLNEEVAGGPGVVNYYSEGDYYYDSFLDVGDIYTVRLQSSIEAEGYSKEDLMANWTTLASLPSMSQTDASEWSVETYYRGTDSLNVMADWVTMDSINQLSQGAPDAWTDWRKFTAGDFTFRIAQFRLKLISNTLDVTPRVFDAKIKSDMPDRIESNNNIAVSALGLRVDYPIPFKGPGTSPNLQVTLDNALSGDYADITNKDLTGFDVTVKDKNDLAKVGQIDYFAKGYGRKQTVVI